MAQERQIRPADSEKKRLTGWLLLLPGFIGIAGLHRFYIGKSFTGLVMLFTFGLLGLWTLLDFITMLSGQFKDSLGLPLKKGKSDWPYMLGSLAGVVLIWILIFAAQGD